MAEAARQYAFTGKINKRDYPEVSCDRHISIKELTEALQKKNNVEKIQHDFKRLGRCYKLKILENLTNSIPRYPTPMEFYISEVTHVTNKDDLLKIMESSGFKARENLSWWSLKIDEGNIKAAEERYLEEVFPNRSQEQKKRQESFLSKYTKSPAFHIDKSRYGNFRFTFPLKELMNAYKEQMCGGQDPVLREYKTMFYRQEIMYVVLVHSPDDNNRFENFPKIEVSPFVDYEEDQIVWKAQAISDNIGFKLELNEDIKIAEVKPVDERYYVWDHVSLAFHFDGVLQFSQETLQNSITCCELDKINLAKGKTYFSRKEAEEMLSKYVVKTIGMQKDTASNTLN
ncbi:hypothetical protein QQF64_028475 [Cirrhinus molitorella]|uniref:Uncharacterized protein n=1 Tax=Cirrhinus molitorella TaxID=172907 RepID=A0ABR3N6P0_9TELE